MLLISGGDILLKKEEHTAKIMEIKEKTHDMDDGAISNLLADLSDDYGILLSKIDEINLQNEKLKNDNDNLRDSNMRLFLRVGKEPDPDETPASEEPKKRTYENLFNEKGDLK